MCGKRISLILFMLLLLFCLSVPGTGYAATYTMTEEQYQSWKALSDRQTQITDELQLRTTNSNESIVKMQKQLQAERDTVNSLKDNYSKLNSLQILSAQIIEQQRQDLLNQQKLIEEQKTLLAKLAKQRNKHYGIGPYADTISAGLMVKKDALIVYGGPAYKGGCNVGAALLYEF